MQILLASMTGKRWPGATWPGPFWPRIIGFFDLVPVLERKSWPHVLEVSRASIMTTDQLFLLVAILVSSAR